MIPKPRRIEYLRRHQARVELDEVVASSYLNTNLASSGTPRDVAYRRSQLCSSR
jgi:hypothetical protein